MNLIQVLVLAVVQGLTEFLPVSSSGHLRALEQWFGLQEPQTGFDVVLHVGTLLATLAVFRRDVWDLLRLRDRRLLGALAVGIAPLLVLGLTFVRWAEENLLHLAWVGGALVLNGVLLLVSRRWTNPHGRQEVSWRDALVIGLVQGLKLRGFSRSGTTIAAGLFRGLSPEAAFRFSFLLSIPAVVMAAGWEGLQGLRHGGLASFTGVSVAWLVLGFAVSFGVGWASLVVLRSFVVRGHFHRFGWYCLALGILVLATSLI
jgi:undecaprenyl-diphosphatase